MNARGQRAVLCSRHQSAWETLTYPVLLPMPLSHVFKRELILASFFGWSMARLGGLFLQRPGVVDVSFGWPIDSRGHTPDSLMPDVEQWIESEMRKLDAEVYKGEFVAEPASIRKASFGT
ncbi:hypothetical protein [Aquabacterium sp.]|uniref:hypothetical protein n=1 Tax=Aquabacterium sp. TaxID=1872578 RepID=UPI0035AEDFB8